MKAHEKGNGNAPKPTKGADAKETASVKSEQVRFSCSYLYSTVYVFSGLFVLMCHLSSLHSVRVA